MVNSVVRLHILLGPCWCMYVCGLTIKFELIAVKVLHTSLLNTTMVAFKVLPLGSYAPMPAPSPPLKTIFELVLWNGLQGCCYASMSSKCLPFNISFIFGNRKKSLGASSSERQGVPTHLFSS